MAKPKHTSGKWAAVVDDESRDDGSDEIVAGGIVIARVEGQDEIRRRILGGRVEGPGSTASIDAADEVDANARIMAAAPDLYRELLDLVRLLEPVESTLSIPGLATLNGARAALALAAEGGE